MVIGRLTNRNIVLSTNDRSVKVCHFPFQSYLKNDNFDKESYIHVHSNCVPKNRILILSNEIYIIRDKEVNSKYVN